MIFKFILEIWKRTLDSNTPLASFFPHNNVGKDFSERSFSCSRFAARPSSTWKNGGNSVEYPGSPPPSERRRGYLGERLEAEVVRRGGGEVGFSFCSWPGGGGGGKWRGNIGESLLLEFAAPWEENKIQASSDCCFQLNPLVRHALHLNERASGK